MKKKISKKSCARHPDLDFLAHSFRIKKEVLGNSVIHILSSLTLSIIDI